MKKTFPLHVPGKTDDRVLDAIKIEVHKYVKRERRKLLPAGFEQWDFACKVGPEQAKATECQTVDDIFPAIDTITKTDSPQVYVEVIATAGKHTRPAIQEPGDGAVI